MNYKSSQWSASEITDKDTVIDFGDIVVIVRAPVNVVAEELLRRDGQIAFDYESDAGYVYVKTNPLEMVSEEEQQIPGCETSRVQAQEPKEAFLNSDFTEELTDNDRAFLEAVDNIKVESTEFTPAFEEYSAQYSMLVDKFYGVGYDDPMDLDWETSDDLVKITQEELEDLIQKAA